MTYSENNRDVNPNHVQAVNYFNYLRRWNLNGVHDLNDFTRKFAPLTDELIADELGRLHVESVQPRLDSIQDLLSYDDLFSTDNLYRQNNEIVTMFSGLQTEVKERFNLNMTTDQIRNILFNEHIKDLNVIATQWSNKNTIAKFGEMLVDQVVMAGHYMTEKPIPENIVGAVRDVLLPMVVFSTGMELSLAVGSNLTNLVIGKVGSTIGRSLLKGGIGIGSQVLGVAGSAKLVNQLEDITTDIAYGDAKRSMGFNENSSNVDWDLVLVGAGLNTVVKGLKGVRKVGKPLPDTKKNTVLSRLRKVFKSAFESKREGI